MSLRARILLLVLVASVLPVLAMFWLLLDNRAKTVVEAREQLVARAQIIANDLDDKISGTTQLLFGLGRVPIVGGEDKAACSMFLAEVLKEHPQYTGLLTIKPDGNLHCDSLRSGRSLNLNDRAYFQQALTAPGVVVEAAVGRLTGKGVLQIAYPVRSAEGVLRYVLLASLDMDAYGHSVAQSLPYARMNFQVWNRDGKVVMDNPAPGAVRLAVETEQREFMLGQSTTRVQTLGAGAQTRIWVKAALPRAQDLGLGLALSVPEADLNERVDGQFRRALFGLAALAVLTFLGAAVLSEFAVRRQAARLMQAISRMDAGHYSPQIGAPYPRGELGDVMQALDRMSRSLAHQHQEIARNTEALERQARIDPLTSLANRFMLTSRLDQALSHAKRANRVAGVLMLDLDRFKTRFGGDEFVVVLADMADVSDIVPVAQKILNSLVQPVEMGPLVLSVSTSLGIAVYPRDGETADELLRYADMAMYRAKGQGGNAMAFFTQEMKQAMKDRLQIEAGLRRALEQGELLLHYQPIIDAKTGRVTSAEALVRWADPRHGLVSPLQFIPIAEETGLIVPIGDWVLREACAQARSWRDLGLGDIPVAVNLSARQFSAQSLEESVAQALQASHCPPSLLQLEITESSIMEQVEQALETMHRLTALGVKLTIDDFGTGYSSLSQLKLFPVSTLKIDRSFVRDIQIDANEDVLVDAIIALAQKLGLRTVAEGVENEAQVAFLAARGCDNYQGFLFSRPCEPDAFRQYVSERNARS